MIHLLHNDDSLYRTIQGRLGDEESVLFAPSGNAILFLLRQRVLASGNTSVLRCTRTAHEPSH